jgi:hypothetical protein
MEDANQKVEIPNAKSSFAVDSAAPGLSARYREPRRAAGVMYIRTFCLVIAF